MPLIITNHTYDVVNGFPLKLMGGGSGLKYAASSIIYLSKRKEKDGTEIIGNIIHCKNYKSRLTKENKVVDVRLTNDKGLDRYYGLPTRLGQNITYLNKFLLELNYKMVLKLSVRQLIMTRQNTLQMKYYNN